MQNLDIDKIIIEHMFLNKEIGMYILMLAVTAFLLRSLKIIVTILVPISYFLFVISTATTVKY